MREIPAIVVVWYRWFGRFYRESPSYSSSLLSVGNPSCRNYPRCWRSGMVDTMREIPTIIVANQFYLKLEGGLDFYNIDWGYIILLRVVAELHNV